MKPRLRARVRRSPATLLAIMFVMTGASLARANEPTNKFSDIRIDNFGQMDERFYRGEQPDREDYAKLAALGIQTIIDLRNDPKEYARQAAEAAGMRYVNIPMSDKKRPDDAQIKEFLTLINDPATGSFYVHCKGGRHRTGVMGAVYRINLYGWDYEQAYQEMKKYDYYSRWGHGALKDYVYDYARRAHEQSVVVNSGVSQPNP